MMNRETFNRHIQQADFRGLFITEMGWNHPHGQLQLPVINVDDVDYQISCIAERQWIPNPYMHSAVNPDNDHLSQD